jgi:hypothetical protein
MKSDFTVKVTPGQSKKIMEILFIDGATLMYHHRKIKDPTELEKVLIQYPYIHAWLWGGYYFTVSQSKEIRLSDIMDLDEEDCKLELVDPNLFISTNGTCEEKER